MIKDLTIYTGEAWRAESGLELRGASALDVIEFEEDELGNIEDFCHLLVRTRMELAEIPASQIVWICKTQRAAKRYGEAERIDVGDNARIIAMDNESGYLVLKGAE